MKTQHIRIGDILPNPFWQGPLNDEVVEKLRESYRSTGCWPGRLVARLRPDGNHELVAHHHLLEALRRELGDGAEVEVIIEDLDDRMMLMRSARENFARRNMTALDQQAVVRAVVVAYGNRTIDLPAPDPNTAPDRLRYAPSFILGGAHPNGKWDPGCRKYTSSTVAAFLGWAEEKVRVVLQALELIERGIATPEDFEGLSGTAARVFVQELRQADLDLAEDRWRVEVAAREQAVREASSDEDRAAAEERLRVVQERDILVDRLALRTVAHEAAQLVREGKAGYRSIKGTVHRFRCPVRRGQIRHPATRQDPELDPGTLLERYRRLWRWCLNEAHEFRKLTAGRLTAEQGAQVRALHEKVRRELAKGEASMTTRRAPG